jgi:hypothetical protein
MVGASTVTMVPSCQYYENDESGAEIMLCNDLAFLAIDPLYILMNDYDITMEAVSLTTHVQQVIEKCEVGMIAFVVKVLIRLALMVS